MNIAFLTDLKQMLTPFQQIRHSIFEWTNNLDIIDNCFCSSVQIRLWIWNNFWQSKLHTFKRFKFNYNNLQYFHLILQIMCASIIHFLILREILWMDFNLGSYPKKKILGIIMKMMATTGQISIVNVLKFLESPRNHQNVKYSSSN